MPGRSRFRTLCIACIVSAAMLHAFSFSFAAGTPQSWEEKYRDEPVVTLSSEQTVELRRDFTTSTRVRLVRKVQKEGGKDIGEISISYDKSREEVKDIEAFTITPGGEKLKPREIQDLALKKEFAVYSDERTKVITMPSVVVGSIVDWQATIETTKPVIEKHFYDVVHLSSPEPVKLRKYTLITPKETDLHIKYINTSGKPAVTYSEDKVIYTWEATDNDKIADEEYMPPWEEISEMVAVSTLDSWEEMSKWAWNLFRKNLRLSDSIKTKVREITKDRESLSEKVQAIIEYIQEDFRYVAMNMDYHSYEPHPSDQVFSGKYGDCKDHTLLGMAMLSEIGVQAYPVLFPSSLSFSRESLLPMPEYFNHAILFFEIDGKKYYTDLLRRGYYFYEVPNAMSKRTVYVVNEGGGFFGTIPQADEDESIRIIEEHSVIRDNGDATVDMTVRLPRSLSISMREDFKNMPEDIREKMFSSFETVLTSGGTVTGREWKHLETPHEKIIVRLKYESPHFVQRVGNMMMFGMPQRKRGTLFTAPKRKYPIVFTAGAKEERHVSYTFPEGYEIVNLPGDVALNYDFARYERRYTAEGNTISGKEMFQYKESRTPPDEYETIRGFYGDITRMTNDMIMIRKKG